MASAKNSSERVVLDIKRKTRRVFGAEEKIRIILEGLRGEDLISAICRQEGIHPSQYYKLSKEFLEAGKKRLSGDATREATAPEVTELREENDSLKQLVAKLSLKNRVLKKKSDGFGMRLGSYMEVPRIGRHGVKHHIV